MNDMQPSQEVLLDIQHIVKKFPLDEDRVLTAVNDVSLKLYKGEALAIVGESGCGKSTLVKCIVRLHRPTSGAVIYDGTDLMQLGGEPLRQSRRHVQMVFQDPATAFNPKMKIKDIICEPLYNFDLIKSSEVEAKAKEMLRLVELPEDVLDRYPANMSGGQRQRVGIARALVLNPEILVCDEATSALDVSVQKKIVDLLLSIQRKTQLSIIFICHDLALVYEMCHRAAVMYLGNIVEVLPVSKLQAPAHPYTKALLRAVFPLREKGEHKVEVLSGDIPSPVDLPKGCPFQDRCVECMERGCRETMPALKEIGEAHQVACHLFAAVDG